jgi:RNase P subunit RPR2
MLELIVGLVGGAAFSWLISHIYNKKSSAQIPEWAKPIIEKFPEKPPTKEELLNLFQDALDKGEVELDPVVGYVACPECQASAKDFKKTAFEDHIRTVVVVECPHCGWKKTIEV